MSRQILPITTSDSYIHLCKNTKTALSIQFPPGLSCATPTKTRKMTRLESITYLNNSTRPKLSYPNDCNIDAA